MNKCTNHTFVILAYKESPFLEDCIKSLLSQTVESNILITTSTPTKHIDKLALKYDIKIYINNENSGVVSDWNFAYKTAKTDLVTLVHQDDIYEKNYLKEINLSESDSCIVFTDYKEIKNGKIIQSNPLLIIKRVLLLPFFIKKSISNRNIKRLVLSFGSPICCPSVTYNKKKLNEFKFNSEYSINMDWDAWLRLAETNHSFTYVSKQLIQHRIHSESETTVGMKDNRREQEDIKIFSRIWGKWLGNLISKIYSLSYKSNN
ncbi:MAG: glycosyltransferase family 2 protein [Candidatus Delongbacteria bacterium]|nr:glycosyltransferase family 2 protein [Candidatus Delongbacteria bacterium]